LIELAECLFQLRFDVFIEEPTQPPAGRLGPFRLFYIFDIAASAPSSVFRQVLRNESLQRLGTAWSGRDRVTFFRELAGHATFGFTGRWRLFSSGGGFPRTLHRLLRRPVGGVLAHDCFL